MTEQQKKTPVLYCYNSKLCFHYCSWVSGNLQKGFLQNSLVLTWNKCLHSSLSTGELTCWFTQIKAGGIFCWFLMLLLLLLLLAFFFFLTNQLLPKDGFLAKLH